MHLVHEAGKVAVSANRAMFFV